MASPSGARGRAAANAAVRQGCRYHVRLPASAKVAAIPYEFRATLGDTGNLRDGRGTRGWLGAGGWSGPRAPRRKALAHGCRADGGPSRGRACLELPGRQHGMPSAQVHFLARHSNVHNLQGNDAPESPLDTYYVCRSMFDVLRFARPRPLMEAHRHESGTRNLRQHSSIDKPTLLNIERGTHDQHRGHARLHRHLDLVATG